MDERRPVWMLEQAAFCRSWVLNAHLKKNLHVEKLNIRSRRMCILNNNACSLSLLIKMLGITHKQFEPGVTGVSKYEVQ